MRHGIRESNKNAYATSRLIERERIIFIPATDGYTPYFALLGPFALVAVATIVWSLLVLLTREQQHALNELKELTAWTEAEQ